MPEAVQALVMRAGIVVNVTPEDLRQLEAIVGDSAPSAGRTARDPALPGCRAEQEGRGYEASSFHEPDLQRTQPLLHLRPL